jgi:hypothetical protein
MRRWALTCVVAVLGIGPPGALAVAASTHPHPRVMGTIIGAILRGGGPRQRHPTPFGGEVTVFQHGKPIAHHRIRAGYLFRFTLAPGRYQLNEGTELQLKPPFNCPPVSARVRAGRAVHVNVYFGCFIP